MEVDPIKDLEIVAHVMTIAKTHQISATEALDLYINQLKLKSEQKKEKRENLSKDLQSRLSPENWESVMKYVRHHPTNSELETAYHEAKREGRLKPAKLLVGGKFYLRNSDFLGNKYVPEGTMLEAEIYDDILCQVWLSPIECEFIFIDELEFI
ncbi:MAG: hypothetical protein QNJ36_21235 [Calothrix sp. MO_167.B42]|nr:hypothetical protein [Calothrix sp. MO_167.B42]